VTEDELVLIVAVVPASEIKQVNLSEHAYHVSRHMTRAECRKGIKRAASPMVEHVQEHLNREGAA
jgi:hypothetical protein